MGRKAIDRGNRIIWDLPIMPTVEAEAKRRGLKLIAVPIEQACQLLIRAGGKAARSATDEFHRRFASGSKKRRRIPD